MSLVVEFFSEWGRVEKYNDSGHDFIKESEEQEKANESGQFKRWLKFAEIVLGPAEPLPTDPDAPSETKDPAA